VTIEKENEELLPFDTCNLYYKTTRNEDFINPVLLGEINPDYPDKVAIAAILAPLLE
jgi:hypothetical protein